MGRPATLIAAQGCWYFGRYGSQSILALSLVHAVLPQGPGAVWGLAPLAQTLGLNMQSPAALAPALIGLIALLDLPFQLIGGFVSDRIGHVRAGIAGFVLLTLSQAALLYDAMFPLAAIVGIVGASLCVSISASLADCYAEGDPAQTNAFRTQALAEDIATVLGPIFCGGVATLRGFHAGFALATCGMALGLICVLVGTRNNTARAIPHAAGGPQPIRVLLWPILLLVPLACIMVGNEQIYDAYPLWAERHADLRIAGHTMPPSWLLSLDAGVSIITQAAILLFWRAWARRRAVPSDIAQITGFAALAALGPLLLAALCRVSTEPLALGWLVAFHLISDTAMAVVQPGALALFGRLAPVSMRALAMSSFIASVRLSDAMAGQLGSALPHLGSTRFWAAHAVIITAGTLCLGIGARGLGRRKMRST